MRRIVQGIAALALVGCGDDRPPAAPAAEVTDSAGVSIVTSLPTGAVYAELAAEPSPWPAIRA